MDASTYLYKVSTQLMRLPVNEIGLASKLIKLARESHQRVWIVGNGGSATTAMHFANDLQKMCGVQAHAIPSEIPTILAYGNDDGWDKMFSNYMKNTFYNGDLLIAISYSGSSMNVVKAAKEAIIGGDLLVLTGPPTSTNILTTLPGCIIAVPSDDMKIVEDVHMVICHTIAGLLQK